MCKLVRFSTLCGILLLVSHSRVAAGDREVTVAYFVEWGVFDRNYHVTNMPAHLVTHVNYAFLNPVYNPTNDTAGLEFHDRYAAIEKVYPGDDPDQPIGGNFNQLIKLKQKYPHLKTLLSIGGYTLSEDFSDIAASSNARSTLADACVYFVTNYQFDGIDVDWEFPVQGGDTNVPHLPEDADNLLLLLDVIRDGLDVQEQADGNEYLLTIAASSAYMTLTNRYRLPETSENLDWINVMAYDQAGPWDTFTGHEAPLRPNPAAPYPGLNASTAIDLYVSNGVPRSKLVLGVPFYGRGFKSVTNENNGLFQRHGGAMPEGSWEDGVFEYKDLKEGTRGHAYIDAEGYVRYWDPVSQVPYLFNSNALNFITYEDEASLELKARYVRQEGLRGIMYWSMDMDTSDYALQRTLEGVFNPLTVSYTNYQGSDSIAVSWYALTGQVYEVDSRSNLLSGEWSARTDLMEAGEGPAGPGVSNRDGRVQLMDTNALQNSGFYRLRFQPQYGGP